MKYIIWDFDGTLGYRDGMWSGTLVDIVKAEFPDSALTREIIRPHLHGVYPWDSPEKTHPHIHSAEQWWDALQPFMENALLAVGFSSKDSSRMASQVRTLYPDLRYWHLFEDAIPFLDALSSQGWKHIILSNHVPELEVILTGLGLMERLYGVFNSAKTGYEKPHPQAFRNALDTIPDARTVWMIGDNYEADVIGAEQIGIPAILVRTQNDVAKRYFKDLSDIPDLLLSSFCQS